MATSLHSLLERKKPSAWSLFLSNPVVFLSKTLYSWRKIPVEPTALSSQVTTVVCTSDTHNSQPNVPEGDVLLHAGDLTQSGSHAEIQATVDWLNTLPHEHKVVIAGNHDVFLDPDYGLSTGTNHKRDTIEWGDVTYLRDRSTTLRCSGGRKIKIYGSPWTPRCGNWAFQHHRTDDIWRDTIPSDTDILITHGPPKGYLDLSNNLGCQFLLEELWRLRNKPRLHVFGHIHEGYGREWALFDGLQRSYDDVMRSNGGGLKLLKMAYQFVVSYLRPKRGNQATLMVNAAMVGGLRDELRRQPVVVSF
ncbi:hypothetical protein FQN54_009104 [Arachnomyces sp. PD_36]|nr:hypothetical protein FQN54_009104 [Arachnomyces sp. PD_36]